MEKDRNLTFRGIVREHLRAAKWSLLAAGLAMIGYTLTELVAPWPLKIIFDHILLDRPVPTSLAWLAELLGHGKTTAVVTLSLLILLIAAFRGGFAYLHTFLSSRIGHELVYRLRGELFSHLQQLSLSFHARARTGELLTKVVSDTAALKDVFAESALNFAEFEDTLRKEVLLTIGAR